MKRSPYCVLAVALSVVTAVSITIADSADERKTVAAMDTEYQAAVKANDAATMDRILADDFILVDGDGTVSTKADLLNEAKSRRVLYEHQEDLEQTVRLWGDTAVVTGKLWGKGIEREKPFDWTLWYSDTYVRTPKGWRYVFGQASLPLPKRRRQSANKSPRLWVAASMIAVKLSSAVALRSGKQRRRLRLERISRFYVPSLHPARYSSCSGVRRSILIPIDSSFNLATRRSRSSGTL